MRVQLRETAHAKQLGKHGGLVRGRASRRVHSSLQNSGSWLCERVHYGMHISRSRTSRSEIALTSKLSSVAAGHEKSRKDQVSRG